uniref:Zinc finger protein 513 n=1 Tax=Takifugu rubripes TaxID=31033 RepID=H2SZK1_TAKRU
MTFLPRVLCASCSVESEDGSEREPSCLALESDFMLTGELEFGDSEIIGLDRDRLGQLRFPSPSPSHLCSPVTCAAGVGLDLGAELYCLTCQEGLQHEASVDSSEAENMKLTEASIIDGSQRKRRIVRRSGGPTALPPKLYSCSVCTFSSHYSNHLKRHMRIHDGQKPYRCPVCPYASAQLVNLQRHARTHTGEKPYRCLHCSYACSSLGNLRRHQRMHAQERPERREKEKRHGRRKKGKAESNEVCVCVCHLSSRCSGVRLDSSTVSGLGFPPHVGGSRLALWTPAQRPLPPLPPQTCRRCSLDLRKEEPSPPCSLAASPGTRRAQRGTNLFQCPHCPFLSHYPNHLARHALSHSEEKPHHCPHCAYTSSHLDNLKRHLRVHTGEKPYQCPSCSYACGNLANLRRHERIHSGAKPFHCGVCSYSCNQSMNLKRHMLRHTGEKPYACAECKYTTGHWDNYKRHQRKHGHNTDNWDKNAPVNSHDWVRDAQESQGQEHS